MEKTFKSDLFDAELAFTLEEADGEVDGQSVIGKMSGTFFVPNGKSRNKRYYPKSLWEKTLARPEVVDRIKNRQMIGTIGHEQILDDNAVLEGKVSHITTKLEVREGKGYGEALILNTRAGRVLKTMVGSGMKMFTSSRALGGYKGEFEGMPIVDEGKYRLKGFDMVLDPGFLEANPSMVEALKESIDELLSIEGSKDNTTVNPTKGKNKMEKELLENFVKENNSLKTDLNDSLTDNETLKTANIVLAEENKTLKESVSSDNAVAEKLEASEKEVSDLKESLSVFEDMGSAEEVETALVEGKKLVVEYKEFGTPEEIDTAITTALAKIKEYKEIGSVDDINVAFERVREINTQRKEEKNEVRAIEFAAEIGAPVESVKKLYNKMSEEEITEMFKDLSDNTSNRFKKTVKLDEGKKTEKTEGRPHYFNDREEGIRLQESFK